MTPIETVRTDTSGPGRVPFRAHALSIDGEPSTAAGESTDAGPSQ